RENEASACLLVDRVDERPYPIAQDAVRRYFGSGHGERAGCREAGDPVGQGPDFQGETPAVLVTSPGACDTGHRPTEELESSSACRPQLLVLWEARREHGRIIARFLGGEGEIGAAHACERLMGIGAA